MIDAFSTDMVVGDRAVMWSDNQGRLLPVIVLDYNPKTGKIKVEREDAVGRYDMQIFWTNYYPSKFYVLPKSP